MTTEFSIGTANSLRERTGVMHEEYVASLRLEVTRFRSFLHANLQLLLLSRADAEEHCNIGLKFSFTLSQYKSLCKWYTSSDRLKAHHQEGSSIDLQELQECKKISDPSPIADS